jgi:hypothetical protein
MLRYIQCLSCSFPAPLCVKLHVTWVYQNFPHSVSLSRNGVELTSGTRGPRERGARQRLGVRNMKHVSALETPKCCGLALERYLFRSLADIPLIPPILYVSLSSGKYNRHEPLSVSIQIPDNSSPWPFYKLTWSYAILAVTVKYVTKAHNTQ